MRSSENLVGIEFSDDSLVVARVTAGSSGSLRLLNVGWARLDPDAPDSEWVAALQRIWRSARISTRTVCVSLRSRSGLLRYFRYPALHPAELASALGLEAEDSLQMPREEIVMDWHLGWSAPVAGSKTDARLEGMLVAASRPQVLQQVEILRQAGLYPVSVDVAPAALANLYVATSPESLARDPVCLLQLSEHRADIALLFGEKNLYARTLYSRGRSWDEAPAPLIEGVQDALKYFVFKLGGQPVHRLLTSGLQPRASDFLAQLQEQTGIPITKWNPTGRIAPGSAHVRRQLAADDRPPLEISLGLALRRYDDE